MIWVIASDYSAYARISHKPALAYYNPLGSVHGGWIATLLDSAVGCAVHSMLPAGKLYAHATTCLLFSLPERS